MITKAGQCLRLHYQENDLFVRSSSHQVHLPLALFPIPESMSTGNLANAQVGIGLLPVLAQLHPWLMGAFAELIHNSYDARVPNETLKLFINRYAHAGTDDHNRPWDVLEIKDYGRGMDHQEMMHMFRMGRGTEANVRD